MEFYYCEFCGTKCSFWFIKTGLRKSSFPNPGLLLLIAWNAQNDAFRTFTGEVVVVYIGTFYSC